MPGATTKCRNVATLTATGRNAKTGRARDGEEQNALAMRRPIPVLSPTVTVRLQRWLASERAAACVPLVVDPMSIDTSTTFGGTQPVPENVTGCPIVSRVGRTVNSRAMGTVVDDTAPVDALRAPEVVVVVDAALDPDESHPDATTIATSTALHHTRCRIAPPRVGSRA